MLDQILKKSKNLLIRDFLGYGFYYLVTNIICIIILLLPQYTWTELSVKEFQKTVQHVQAVVVIFYIYIIINGTIVLKSAYSLFSSNREKILRKYIIFIAFIVILYFIIHLILPITLLLLGGLFNVHMADKTDSLLIDIPIISTLKNLIIFSSYFVCLPFSWARFMHSGKTLNDITLLGVSILLSEISSAISSSLIISSARNTEMFLYFCPYTIFDELNISSADGFLTCFLALFNIGNYPIYALFLFAIILYIYHLASTVRFLSNQICKDRTLFVNARNFHLGAISFLIVLCIIFQYCMNSQFFYSKDEIYTSDTINKLNTNSAPFPSPDLSNKMFQLEFQKVTFETEKAHQQYLESIRNLLSDFQRTLEVSQKDRIDQPSYPLMSRLGSSLDQPIFYPVVDHYFVEAKNDYAFFTLYYILGQEIDTKFQFIKLTETISKIITEGDDLVSLRRSMFILLKEIKLLCENKWLDTNNTYAVEQLLNRIRKEIFLIYSNHSSLENYARTSFCSLFSEGKINMMPFNRRKSIVPMTNCKIFFPLIYLAFQTTFEEWVKFTNVYLTQEISDINNISKLISGILRYNSLNNILSFQEIINTSFRDVKIGIFNHKTTYEIWGTTNEDLTVKDILVRNQDMLFIWIPGYCNHEKDLFDTPRSRLVNYCHVAIDISPLGANIHPGHE